MNYISPKRSKFKKDLWRNSETSILFTIINDSFKQTKDLHFFKNLHIHVSENIPLCGPYHCYEYMKRLAHPLKIN